MRNPNLFRCLVVICALVVGSDTPAATLVLRRSPLAGATLPSGTTYEVEFNTGGSWVPAGVLIAGSGSSNVVRLDGFPENAAYRLARVGTGDIVSPSVSYGLHLAASAPGTTEMRFQIAASVTGSSWTHDAFSFPDADGWFVRPIRPPFSTQAFFRSLTPAQPLAPAGVAFYALDVTNSAGGFGLVLDDMPQMYRDGYVAAPCAGFYNRGGQNAAAAGECYELAGAAGNVTVMVGDFCGDPPAGTCDSGPTFFDLGGPAFAALFPPAIGTGRVNYRLVPAPVTGNLKMVVTGGSSDYWFALRPYNHRAGISKLEIRGPVSGGTGGNWTELPRQQWNAFEYAEGTPVGFPLEVRVTSRFGEVVAFPAITSMAEYSRFVANAQFVVFPDLEPPPVWVLPPVYTDALTDVFGCQWTIAPWGGMSVDLAYTGATYTGTASMRITNLAAWCGMNFIGPWFQPAADDFLEFAAKAAGGSSVSNLVVSFGGSDNQGAPATSPSVALPAIGSAWRVFRIPLQPAQAPSRVQWLSIMNQSAVSQAPVLLDAISFVRR